MPFCPFTNFVVCHASWIDFDMMFSSGFSEAKNMTNSDGQSMSRRSSMRLKNNSAVENEDSDMESVDSDDLMVMYDSASEGEEGGMLDEDDATAEEVEESSNVQESTRIDKDVEDGLTASEDDDDDNGDAENHTAHTTINEDPEENASMTGGIAMGSSLKPAKDSDDMKIDIPAVAASSLPNSPSRRYPTRHSFRESQGDAAVEHAGTSTMRSVSTNMHITTAAAQDTSPRSQRYQKRAETRKEGKDFHQEKKRDSREGCNKECVTVVVRDAR